MIVAKAPIKAIITSLSIVESGVRDGVAGDGVAGDGIIGDGAAGDGIIGDGAAVDGISRYTTPFFSPPFEVTVIVPV